MSESKHTPGPWIMSHQDPWAAKATIHQDNENKQHRKCRLLPLIAEVNVLVSGQGFENIGAANARLIAAAPELLEAAKWLIECYNDGLIVGHPTSRRAIDSAEAAIAKAEKGGE